MYELEIDKKELDLINVALQDSKDRLLKQINEYKSKYLELPEHVKGLWNDEEAYKEYTESMIKECIRELNAIGDLEEKLEKII